MKPTITMGQWKALAFVSMLSPFLRLLPAAVTRQAGSAAWVSGLLSVLPALLLAWMLRAGKTNPAGGSLAEQILRVLGRFPGSVVLCLWTLWLLVHSGFLLRSGAERFIATIYPGTSPHPFLFVTLGLCLIAAYGSLKAMGRLSEILRPLLLLVIIPVLLFSLEDVEPVFLLPVTREQSADILRGLPLAAEPVSVALVIAAFLRNRISPTEKQGSMTGFVCWSSLLAVIFCIVCVGNLGKTYTASIAYPFFVLARDLSIISGVERIEALVVALWFLPDFVLITVELMIVLDNLSAIAGHPLSKKQNNILLVLMAAWVLTTAFSIPAGGALMERWSECLVPMFHLFWAYGFIPLLLLVSAVRKKF